MLDTRLTKFTKKQLRQIQKKIEGRREVKVPILTNEGNESQPPASVDTMENYHLREGDQLSAGNT